MTTLNFIGKEDIEGFGCYLNQDSYDMVYHWEVKLPDGMECGSAITKEQALADARKQVVTFLKSAVV